MGIRDQQWERVRSTRVIAILRSERSDQLVKVAEALLEGGIDIIEVTFTVPNALQVIEAVADRLGDRALIGAGTVLDAETARSAMLAGAEFFVSPGTSAEVIHTCRRYGKLVMPGALTPTEVLQAWELGCDAVKVFPVDVLGAKHIKALKGPLPQIPMIPTGGIHAGNAADFIEAGATAIGVGGCLAPKDAIAAGDFDLIRSNAKALRETVKEK